MTNGKSRNWNELLEQRRDSWLVGRHREREIFRLNFIYEVPEHLIFAVSGPPGAGKSALLRHYEATATEHGASTVFVDAAQRAVLPEQTLLAVMTHIARQLFVTKTSLTTFDEQYARYNEMLTTMMNDPAAPSRVFDFLTGFIHVEDNAAWDAYLDKKLWTPDQVALVKHPVDTLTHAFLQDLGAWATIRTILFCFDDWDVLSSHLGVWLQDALRSERLTSNVWLAIAGEKQLDTSWEPFRPVTAAFDLQMLDAADSRSYLFSQGVRNAEQISAIWTYAKGSPLWMRVLSGVQNVHSEALAVNAFDRYLKGLEAPWQHDLVLRCAVARRLDADVVAALIEDQDPAKLEWLTQSHLVVERYDGWVYHPALRTEALTYAQQYAPKALQTAHSNLYDYYCKGHDVIEDLDLFTDPQWREMWLECLYHGLLGDKINAVDSGLEAFILTLRVYYPFAGKIVETWVQAASELVTPNAVADWVQPLETGWRSLLTGEWQAVLDFCEVFAQHKGLRPEVMQELHAVRQLAKAHLAPEPAESVAPLDVDEATLSEEPAPAEVAADEVAEPSALDGSEALPVGEPVAAPTEQEKEPPLKGVETEDATAETHSTKSLEKSAEETDLDALAAVEPELSVPLEQDVHPSPEVSQVATTKDAVEIGTAESKSAAEPEETAPQKDTSVTKSPVHASVASASSTESEIDSMDYVNRANVYLSMGEYEKAIRDYDRATTLDPNFASAYYNRGLAYIQLRNFDTALADFTKTIELNPRYAPAYKNRGLCYARKRNFDRAVVDYTQAIELSSEDGAVFNNRANAYYNLQAYLEAIEDYDHAIECDPAYAPAYLNRGLAYASIDEYQRAIADYNQSISLSPNQAAAYNYRGQAYARLEQYANALSDYAQALTFNPKYTAAHNNRGLALARLGNYAEAIAAYQQAVATNPKFVSAYYNAACAAALMGDLNDACEWLEKAISLNPQYREMARKDVDFNAIRESHRFQRLLEGS